MGSEGFWAALEAAGPSASFETFDPLLVDDVLTAERSNAQYDRRKAFVASYAWAVPTREAIERIRDALGERDVLEVCAGNGLWASLLADAGLCVTATDWSQPGLASYVPVATMEASEAVRAHPHCQVLLFCWPPFRDECAFRALRSFEGDHIVYIGDVRFTAEARFHGLLASSWTLLDQIPLPSWPGTSDCVSVYGRRGTSKC